MTIVFALTAAAPLIVAAACIGLYRQTRSEYLVFWAVAHVALAATLAFIGTVDWRVRAEPLLWAPPLLGHQVFSWLILFGVLNFYGHRLSLRASVLLAFAIGLAQLVALYVVESLPVYGPVVVGSFPMLIAAGILWRSGQTAAEYLAGVILACRGLNALVVVGQDVDYLRVIAPEHFVPLSIFLNLLTGLGLMMIATGDARRRLEQSVAKEREAISLLSALFDAVPAIVTQKDRNLVYAAANRHALQAMGAQAPQMIGRRLSDLDASGMSDQIETLDRRLLAGGNTQVVQAEVTGTLPDGRSVTMLTRKAPLVDAHGHVSGIVSVNFDVTEQKRIERELRESQNLLLKAQRLGRAAFARTNLTTREVYWSDALFELRMIPKRPLVSIEETFDLFHPDDRPRYAALREGAMAQGTAFQVEMRVRYGDGQFHWEYIVGQPEFDASGRLSEFLVFVQDITPLKEREMQIIEANQQLQDQAVRLEELNVRYRAEREVALQADRAKTEFLANMSHELRTPLNAVIGYAELMAKQILGPLAPRYLEYATDIMSSGQHLLSVINDILDMSQIESGMQPLTAEATDLASLIEAAVKLVALRATAQKQELTWTVAPDVPVTRVDTRAVKQALLNLLSNAIKFTPSGGKVAVRCSRNPAGWIVVEVADNGRGIAAADLKNVFVPFWQAESALTRSHEGSGLGLSISRKLIEMHGGTLEIESELGRGTTATIMPPPSISIE